MLRSFVHRANAYFGNSNRHHFTNTKKIVSHRNRLNSCKSSSASSEFSHTNSFFWCTTIEMLHTIRILWVRISGTIYILFYWLNQFLRVPTWKCEPNCWIAFVERQKKKIKWNSQRIARRETLNIDFQASQEFTAAQPIHCHCWILNGCYVFDGKVWCEPPEDSFKFQQVPRTARMVSDVGVSDG